MKRNELLKKALEEFGWKIKDDGDWWEMTILTPLDDVEMDYSLHVGTVSAMKEEFYEIWQDFDPEEHVRMFMDCPGALCIRRLLADADEHDRDLDRTYSIFFNWWRDYNRETLHNFFDDIEWILKDRRAA